MGTILVTGASRGIGRGITLELASTGHSVAIIHYDANNDPAEETVEQCTAIYGKNKSLHAAFFKANIGSAEDRQRLVKWATETFGEIDGLVNNAGIAPRQRDDIIYAKEEIFDEVLKVNLYGPYFLTQLVAQKWLEEAQQNTSSAKNKTRRRVPLG
jgi:NAD(P)-dependent dehydrogenase (short-subunit alcohol dehydrogenase family)